VDTVPSTPAAYTNSAYAVARGQSQRLRQGSPASLCGHCRCSNRPCPGCQPLRRPRWSSSQGCGSKHLSPHRAHRAQTGTCSSPLCNFGFYSLVARSGSTFHVASAELFFLVIILLLECKLVSAYSQLQSSPLFLFCIPLIPLLYTDVDQRSVLVTTDYFSSFLCHCPPVFNLPQCDKIAYYQ
jgi:hypothetical protein